MTLIKDMKWLMYGLSRGSNPSNRREFNVAATIRNRGMKAPFKAEISKKVRNSPSMNVA